MRIINRRFPLLVLLSLALPALAGWALTGPWRGAATGLLWGGLVRIFFVHHVTWSVNSVCHFLARAASRRTISRPTWRGSSLLSFGESWHHNHHAFPRSAAHGLRRWEHALDPSALVIKTMEKLGLARNVVRITPERQSQRLTEVQHDLAGRPAAVDQLQRVGGRARAGSARPRSGARSPRRPAG